MYEEDKYICRVPFGQLAVALYEYNHHFLLACSVLQFVCASLAFGFSGAERRRALCPTFISFIHAGRSVTVH